MTSFDWHPLLPQMIHSSGPNRANDCNNTDCSGVTKKIQRESIYPWCLRPSGVVVTRNTTHGFSPHHKDHNTTDRVRFAERRIIKRNATNADRDQIKNVRVYTCCGVCVQQRSVMTFYYDDDITRRPPFYRCGYVPVTSAVGVNPRYPDNVTRAEQQRKPVPRQGNAAAAAAAANNGKGNTTFRLIDRSITLATVHENDYVRCATVFLGEEGGAGEKCVLFEYFPEKRRVYSIQSRAVTRLQSRP